MQALHPVSPSPWRGATSARKHVRDIACNNFRPAPPGAARRMTSFCSDPCSRSLRLLTPLLRQGMLRVSKPPEATAARPKGRGLGPRVGRCGACGAWPRKCRLAGWACPRFGVGLDIALVFHLDVHLPRRVQRIARFADHALAGAVICLALRPTAGRTAPSVLEQLESKRSVLHATSPTPRSEQSVYSCRRKVRESCWALAPDAGSRQHGVPEDQGSAQTARTSGGGSPIPGACWQAANSQQRQSLSELSSTHPHPHSLTPRASSPHSFTPSPPLLRSPRRLPPGLPPRLSPPPLLHATDSPPSTPLLSGLSPRRPLSPPVPAAYPRLTALPRPSSWSAAPLASPKPAAIAHRCDHAPTPQCWAAPYHPPPPPRPPTRCQYAPHLAADAPAYGHHAP
jgi:hypothetical protein